MKKLILLFIFLLLIINCHYTTKEYYDIEIIFKNKSICKYDCRTFYVVGNKICIGTDKFEYEPKTEILLDDIKEIKIITITNIKSNKRLD